LGFVDDEAVESRIPNPESRLIDVIRERGPMTVAAFMDLALYDSEHGYYARVVQRSGRAGDFFTSVDVGPVFGELLEIQLAEMSRILTSSFKISNFDLVDAGAGNARLSADILRSARLHHPAFYDAIRLHLVEASAAARAAQAGTLGEAQDRIASSGPEIPASFEGALIANELLDAMPVHQVVMREDGLNEVYVTADVERPFQRRYRGGDPQRVALHVDGDPQRVALHLIEGPPSTPALQEYLDRLGITLEPGWRVEINLRAVEWVRDAARRLRRGFIILIDYGHEARELYSPTHADGTLTTFAGHRSAGPETGAHSPAWLRRPGERDITAHVDFTSVRAAGQAEGLTAIALLDQTYFLMGLLPAVANPQSAIRNPQLKTLILPGGLGSTHKALILAKGVGNPALLGCSFRVRAT
jgi:SAM-dependent MidA family methyltransferase